MICAEFYGIKLNTANANNNGGVIARNWIHSVKGGQGGPTNGIVHPATIGTDTLTMIADNRISAVEDAILGFTTGQVQGNIVGVASAAPVSETGQ